MIEKLAIPLLLLLQLLSADAAAIMQRPVNLAVVMGSPIEMPCRWNGSTHSDLIDWFHTPIGGDEKQISEGLRVYVGGFRIANASANGTVQNDLIIDRTDLLHAGIYSCSGMVGESGHKTDTYAAELIVLATPPVCTLKSNITVLEKVNVEISCVITSRGNVRPTVEWTIHGSDRQRRTMNGTNKMVSETADYTLILVADSTLTGSKIQSRTIFREPPGTLNDHLAKNIPDYVYVWESPIITVLYGPSNVTITPPGNILHGQHDPPIYFHPNDQLNCSANGSPKPRLQWINMETMDVVNSSVLVLGETMAKDRVYEFVCRATNAATNRTSLASTKFWIKERSSMTASRTDMILVISIIAATLAATAIIVASLCSYIGWTKQRKKRRDLPEDRIFRTTDTFTGRYTDQPKSMASGRSLTPPMPPSMKVGAVQSHEYLCPSIINSSYALDYAEIPYAESEGYLEFGGSDHSQRPILPQSPSDGSRQIHSYQDRKRNAI